MHTLKSPSGTMESPTGAPCRTLFRVSNMAEYSELQGMPTPARQLTPWATLERNRVQSLCRSLVPEPKLSLEVSATRSNQKRSTSCKSSGSFPDSEVKFHVPKPASAAQVQSVYALCLHHHLFGSAPDPSGSSHRWWADRIKKRPSRF